MRPRSWSPPGSAMTVEEGLRRHAHTSWTSKPAKTRDSFSGSSSQASSLNPSCATRWAKGGDGVTTKLCNLTLRHEKSYFRARWVGRTIGRAYHHRSLGAEHLSLRVIWLSLQNPRAWARPDCRAGELSKAVLRQADLAVHLEYPVLYHPHRAGRGVPRPGAGGAAEQQDPRPGRVPGITSCPWW